MRCTEKVVEKMWNRLVDAFPIRGDYEVPSRCVLFCERLGPRLMAFGLRYPVLFHLLTLWEFGLIESSCMVRCMRIFDLISPQQIARYSHLVNNPELPVLEAPFVDIDHDFLGLLI